MSSPEETQLKAAYYYSCLYNSLVLFAASPSYLDSLAGPAFDPLFELKAEYDYAFRDPAFEENFTNGKVSEALREELLAFKSHVTALPDELQAWNQLMSNEAWDSIQLAANELLTKMGESRRTYDAEFTVNIPAK